ncbi:MAG: methionyl-tRNA formyltransferase [Spirochaetes bacterium]|nr:methionyl-tRNA formyltransferase [Spirochaetota bacterium]
MRIGFFGTPELAARCLRYLHERHSILFLVTGEDKKTGRHQRLQHPAAKAAALELGIPVLQPVSVRDDGFISRLKEFDADIYVIVAYGRIIPRSIFDHPPLKTVNLHPSLLPRYRGAAPIEWAVMQGEEVTGITVQLINEKLDAGDIVLQERIPVPPDFTAGDLYDTVMAEGGALLHRSMEMLAEGAGEPVGQDESAATYCGKIDRDTARIDWTRGAVRIHNLVRGMNPKPVAWTTFRSKQARIWKTAPFTEPPERAKLPGELARFGRKRLLVGTGDGMLEILRIQPENRDVMDGLSFLNGYRPETGEALE